MKYNKKVITAITAVLLSASASVQAAPALVDNPFSYFNVYSLGDIGSTTDGYGSDFQGVVGASGNMSVENFGFVNMEGADYVAHVGGDFSAYRAGFMSYSQIDPLTGANVTVVGSGDLDVAGDIAIKSMTWNGDVYGGGDITHNPDHIAWGTISGQTSIAGSYSGNSGSNGYTFADGLNTGVSYEAMMDFEALDAYFSSTSSLVGEKSDTGVIVDSYGKLTLNASSGENVFSLTAEQLNIAHTIEVIGPADATVFINVGGVDVALDGTTWKYSGGLSAAGVVLNYSEATALTVNARAFNEVNILAPFADVLFSSGLITGNLITGSLMGSGQVNLGHFNGGFSAPVPAPAPLFLLTFGLVALLITRLKFVFNR